MNSMTSLSLWTLIGYLVMLASYVTGIPTGATYLSPEEQRMQNACRNHYDYYCTQRDPRDCYHHTTSHLCCATCMEYREMFGYTAENEVCLFGDRNTTCGDVDTKHCYDADFRHDCCGTCGEVITDMSDCRYGDKDDATCANINPWDCYNDEISTVCCGTCARHYRERAGCEYGDRREFFSKGPRIYSCSAYVGYFGYTKCMWDKRFRSACCATCARAHRSKFNRIARFVQYRATSPTRRRYY